MRILILGGTKFFGRAITEEAMSRSHEVSIFHRGESGADLFPGIDRHKGDRNGGLDSLEGGSWDAVIDMCGYFPRVVRRSTELLIPACKHYTFISSLSVFADESKIGIVEDDPVSTIEDDTIEEITEETYGALKALCETVVNDVYSDQALIIRPGLIVGPNDHTDRFTYWPHRIAAGGDVLLPGMATRPTQFVDARDLASWTVSMVEAGESGAYNAVGPAGPPTMGDIVTSSMRAARSYGTRSADIHWVDEQFLLDRDVEPWSDLPLWVPDIDPRWAGFAAFDCTKAISAGLTFRSLDDTVADTLAWDRSRGPDYEWSTGLARTREAELLAEWLEMRR